MKKKLPIFNHVPNDAIEAGKNGNLEEWVQKLLISEGNEDLAKSLSNEKPICVSIVKIPLKLLKKIEGPEEQIEHRQPLDIWENRVSKLVKLIEGGYKPAPLLVTDYWNYFEIADGNHRHEALVRLGTLEYWTIFFIKHEEGKKYLESILKNRI